MQTQEKTNKAIKHIPIVFHSIPRKTIGICFIALFVSSGVASESMCYSSSIDNS